MNHPISLKEATWVWCRVAALSFGGPAGQIAVMHRILVDEKKWVTEEQFLHALSYCMLLPGPEAQQLATYIGWLLHRTIGGLIAGLLFILPGFVSIMALSIIYAVYQDTPVLTGLFLGLKCAVIAIVLEAVIRIGKRVLTDGFNRLLAMVSFALIFFLSIPFPLILIVAAIVGALRERFRSVAAVHTVPETTAVESVAGVENISLTHSPVSPSSPALGRSIRLILLFGVLWFTPTIILWQLFGADSVFVKESIFFSETAVVTFGGAYAVLAFIAQQAVDRFGWLDPGEMMDGLGMAETTPGPLIMVVQFVGFMAAFRHGQPDSPLLSGVLGAFIVTWATFVPCFLWIFLGAPYIERLRGLRILNAVMSAITAAVVGVIINLAVWFSLHTLFSRLISVSAGPFRLILADWSSPIPIAIAITLIAVVLTRCYAQGMAIVLAVCTALGIVAQFCFRV